MQKKCYITRGGPKAVGPYSTAVISGGIAFLSGVVPIDPQTNALVDGGIQRQTHMVLDNIGTILKELETGYENVLKSTIYLTDLAHFSTVNDIYRQYFTDDYPARTCVEVSRLPLEAMIEIEIIAAINPHKA